MLLLWSTFGFSICLISGLFSFCVFQHFERKIASTARSYRRGHLKNERKYKELNEPGLNIFYTIYNSIYNIVMQINFFFGVNRVSVDSTRQGFSYDFNAGKPLTMSTVSKLTVMTCPIKRRIYSGSSSRFGSFLMPLRLSILTRY